MSLDFVMKFLKITVFNIISYVFFEIVNIIVTVVNRTVSDARLFIYCDPGLFGSSSTKESVESNSFPRVSFPHSIANRYRAIACIAGARSEEFATGVNSPIAVIIIIIILAVNTPKCKDFLQLIAGCSEL